MVSQAHVIGSMHCRFLLFPTSISLVWKNSNEYINRIRFLWYTVECILFGVLMTKTSKNGIAESFSISIVNMILLWKLFNVFNMRFVESTFAKKIVLCTYLFHIVFFFTKPDVIFFSSPTIKMFASTSPKRERMVHHQFYT